MEIKLTPLVMFLLILSVLALSMIIGNYFVLKDQHDRRQMENFISFNYNATSHNGNSVRLAPYSTGHSIVEVYDSIYFDETNGNLLEIYGNIVSKRGISVGGNIDLTAKSINQLNVITRFNYEVTYPTSKLIASNGSMNSDAVKESRISPTPEAYDAWTYITQNTANDSYSVIYIPWVEDTYIHVIDSAGNNILSMLDTYGTSNVSILYTGVTTKPSGPMSQTSYTSSSRDGIFVTNASYNTMQNKNTQIYSLTSQVFYDPSGYIYVQQDPNTPGVIYDRMGKSNGGSGKVTSGLQNISNFTSWVTPSPSAASGSYGPYVLVMCAGYKTVLAVLTSNSAGFGVGPVAKFMGENQSLDSATNASNGGDNNDDDNNDDDDGNSNTWHGSNKYSYNDVFNKCGADFSKWGSQCWQKFYQLSYTSSGSLINTNVFSDDYILKTQVVPPVCPSCPSCPQSLGNVCTNCGGNGGSGIGGGGEMAASGSVSANGNASGSAVSGNNVTSVGSGTFASNANADTFGGSLTLSTLDTVAGIEDVAKTGAGVITNSVGAVGGLANNVVDSATGLASGAGTGIKDVVTGTGSGAYNLVSGGASGANSLLRDTASGAVNLTRDRHGDYDRSGGSHGGGGSQGSYAGGGGQGSYDNGGQGSYAGGSGQGSYGGGGGQGGPDSNFGRMKGGPVDNLSYYGALQSKGNANFMPVTADFSNFRK